VLSNTENQTNKDNGDVVGALAVDHTVQSTPVNTFHDDSKLIQGCKVPSSSKLLKHIGSTVQEINEFLERPKGIFSATWPTTTASRTLLNALSFPNVLFNVPSISRKLDSFKYMRADIELTVRINAAPQHLGRLMLSFYPRHKYRTYIPYYESSFTYHAGLHNIMVDPNDSNSVVLTLPWCLPKDFWNLDEAFAGDNNDSEETGTVFIWVMNQLVSDCNQPVNFTIYANFKNVHLAGTNTTQRTLVTTASLLPTVLPDPDYNLPRYIMNNVSAAGFVTQSGYVRDPEAEEKSKEGLISGPALRMARFAEPFKSIPLVGGVAELIANGAMGLGGVAKALGFSNPQSLESTKPTFHAAIPTHYLNGLQQGVVLGATVDDKVAPVPFLLGGTDDDMQISRIISTPGFIGCTTFHAADVAGATIESLPLTPLNCGYNTTNKRIYHTHLSYVASLFTYWRGSLKFRLQFVATPFSSMRVRVSYLPAGAAAPTNESDLGDLDGAIIDVNGPTDFAFTVPYLHSAPWLTVGCNSINANYGSVLISVVNPLTSCRATILPMYCNIWIAAGPDMQFARLTGARLASTFSHQSVRPRETGLSLERMKGDVYQPLTKYLASTEQNVCHGDCITSVKEIVTRKVSNSGPPTAATESGVMPYGWPKETANGGVNKHTYMSYFSKLFKYVRGGFNVNFYNYNNDSYTWASSCVYKFKMDGAPYFTPPLYTSSTKPTEAFSNDTMASTSLMALPTNNINVTVPFVSDRYAITTNTDMGQTIPYLRYYVKTNTYVILVGAADDFSYAYMLGAPTNVAYLTPYFGGNEV